MFVRRMRWPIICGVIWSLLFACMSFYWASGGMIGVDTLGPEISRQAVVRSDRMILIVWLTGVAKVLGAFLLLGLAIRWESRLILKILHSLTITGGILLFVYGLLNFAAVLLAMLRILSIQVDPYSAWWRLLFWEPFWMAGGLFYFISGRMARAELISRTTPQAHR